MTTVLEIAFPWGRYHATPWGRHVNEAQVEWPPSPWRILRALYATWRARAPHLDESGVHAILTRLAEPPAFVLPSYMTAHTRHYMPDIGRGMDLAFDAFAVFESGGRIMVSWSADLDPKERTVLGELASLLPYLGRGESICEARLLDGAGVAEGALTEPVSDEDRGVSSEEQSPVRVLVARTPLDVSELTVRTADLRSKRYVDPPGARWQEYTRPRPIEPVRPRERIRAAQPAAVRWVMSGPAPPSRRAALVMTDVLRAACMARYGRRFAGAVSETLAGKADGTPLKGHAHAHYFALDQDGDRLLDHLVLWAPTGLDQQEVQALADLDRLIGYRHISEFRPTRLALVGLGDTRHVAPELVGPATRWRSFTPFAPPRHAKRRTPWTQHVDVEVRRELTSRGFPEPRDVQAFRGDWLAYRRHRVNERLEDARRGTGVEITFADPVAGPIALGALSHFGLGLFLPHDDDRRR